MDIAWKKEMQHMDENAIKAYGISDVVLMENAGMAAYQVISKNLGVQNKQFLIFCGTGNNGGDGLVLARKLYSNGAFVKICILNNPEKFHNAAQTNWHIIQNLKIPVFINPSLEEINALLSPEDIVVDAIFGTGLTKDIRGILFQVVQTINQSNNPVVSIDIPSGINADNGKICGIAIKADYTVTFGLPKVGNILYPGYEYGGKLYISTISFPPELYKAENIKIHINQPTIIPQRTVDGHKGTFGNALFIAGAQNYFGSPYFSSLSFLKAGGGYSRLAAPASMIPYISLKASEVVFLPQKETVIGTIALNNFDHLLEWSKKMDIIVIGPGLSLQEETQLLIQKLIPEIDKPLLIDGDGLTVLSQDLSILKKRQSATILTPHLGEMARITKKSIEEIQKDPIHMVREFSQKLNAILVLKGAHSIIGLPDDHIFINMTGNSGMASAGSGDTLTGTIAAMFTLGLPIESAVRQGTMVHGLAGDLAAREKGEDGMTAQDIMDAIPKTLKLLRESQTSARPFFFQGFETIG
ncbi:MAG: NAD(P)H-hydrate dehydratase [Candidatus Atribacteria bacterium]|nr:NAD(P)H-hydrate dehydratase [Candidatus Atribacteria bacterium]